MMMLLSNDRDQQMFLASCREWTCLHDRINLFTIALIPSQLNVLTVSFAIELEMRSAQNSGDTYRMNICRDQIAQLEKQVIVPLIVVKERSSEIVVGVFAVMFAESVYCGKGSRDRCNQECFYLPCLIFCSTLQQ